MKDCECLEKCDFFNDKMANMPSMANLLKKKYCQGDNSECARFMVYKAIGKDYVPSNLYPSQIERVNEIIKSK